MMLRSRDWTDLGPLAALFYSSKKVRTLSIPCTYLLTTARLGLAGSRNKRAIKRIGEKMEGREGEMKSGGNFV